MTIERNSSKERFVKITNENSISNSFNRASLLANLVARRSNEVFSSKRRYLASTTLVVSTYISTYNVDKLEEKNRRKANRQARFFRSSNDVALFIDISLQSQQNTLKNNLLDLFTLFINDYNQFDSKEELAFEQDVETSKTFRKKEKDKVDEESEELKQKQRIFSRCRITIKLEFDEYSIIRFTHNTIEEIVVKIAIVD